MGKPSLAVEMVEELGQVMDTDQSEFVRFQEVLDLWKKIEEVTQKQQDLMVQDIKMLCNMVEDNQQRLENSAGRNMFTEREKQTRDEMSKAEQHKELVQRQCETVQEEMIMWQREEAKLVADREVVENDTTRVLPKIRYDLNLYNMICRIRWQYDSDPEDIKGYVCNKGDVKPFSLSTKLNSKFFITNYLWDLIEEGVSLW